MKVSLLLLTWLTLLLGAGCTPPCTPEPPGTVGSPTDWEAAFLAGRQLPPVPARQSLTAEDGLELSFTDWAPRGWAGTGPSALVVHGSSARGDLYSVLGKELAARGIYTRLIDLRGHGYSRCPQPGVCNPSLTPDYADTGVTWPGRPGDSADPDQHARDLTRLLTDLQVRTGSRPLLVGHSSGAGLVARHVVASGQTALAGTVLIAPFANADQPQNNLEQWECGRVVGTTYARVDLGAVGDARRGNPHRYVLRLEKDEAFREPLDTSRYTYNTMLGLAVPDAKTYHGAFAGRTLWVAGERDALLDLERSRAEYARLPGGTGLVMVRDTSHIGVIWSPGVAAVIADFLAGRSLP
jgi:pimeloyl-ACP methyl ester carboxylesterase